MEVATTTQTSVFHEVLLACSLLRYPDLQKGDETTAEHSPTFPSKVLSSRTLKQHESSCTTKFGIYPQSSRNSS